MTGGIVGCPEPDRTLSLDVNSGTQAEIAAGVAAAADFQPLDTARMNDVRRRAAVAVQGKGRCHWDPQ